MTLKSSGESFNTLVREGDLMRTARFNVNASLILAHIRCIARCQLSQTHIGCDLKNAIKPQKVDAFDAAINVRKVMPVVRTLCRLAFDRMKHDCELLDSDQSIAIQHG